MGRSLRGGDESRDRMVPSGNSKAGEEEAIRKEISEMSKYGYPSRKSIREIMKKYPNKSKIIDEILYNTHKDYARGQKHATKMAEKIYKLIRDGRTSHHKILMKVAKMKAEKNMSDTQFEAFENAIRNIMRSDDGKFVKNNNMTMLNESRINKSIGAPETNMTIERRREKSGIFLEKGDEEYLKKILKMYRENSHLHKSTFMRSLMYRDVAPEALSGRVSNNSNNYIHPVIAAMFLPKIDVFEKHFLHSNFGSIINIRNNGEMIMSGPDIMLFSDITSDPNDVVCDIDSAMGDLMNRYAVQIELWKTVNNLRAGQYYESGANSSLISKLNNCRHNIYDDADLSFNQDEGSMMKRLMSVFSFRPTIISTRPNSMFANVANMPGHSGIVGVGAQMHMTGGDSGIFVASPINTITNIPMLTAQLPPAPIGDNANPLDLKSSITKTVWFNNSGGMVPHEHTVVYSKQVLIFYVNRRVQRLNFKTLVNPVSFSMLPSYHSMSNFERLNSYPISAPDSITLSNENDTYELRSVVTVNETNIDYNGKQTNIIVGSSAMVIKRQDFGQRIYESSHFLYDPFGASIAIPLPDAKNNKGQAAPGYGTNKPVTLLDPYFSSAYTDGSNESKSFAERAKHNGTIFIYAKTSGYNNSEPIMF